MTTVNETPYIPPPYPAACEICDAVPAKYYRPAELFLCAGCIVDHQIVHAPRRQEP